LLGCQRQGHDNVVVFDNDNVVVLEQTKPASHPPRNKG